MPSSQGLVLYSKLTIALHMKDLEVELLHRGVTETDIPKGIRDRKKRLKDMEMERVGSTDKATAEKAFKPLSTAPFKLQSDT